MIKNTASQVVAFQMVSSTDGSDVTTGTPAVYYTVDGGTQGTGAGAKVSEGHGQWSYVPAQAETNGDHVAFTMVLSGAISQTINVWPVSFDPTDSVRLGLTSLPNASANAAGGLPVSIAGGLDMDAIKVVTDNLPDAGALDDLALILADTNETQGKLPTNYFMGSSDGTDDDGTLNTIAVDVAGINGDAMRGTDSAATAANLALVDTVVDAIKAVTDNLPDAGALDDLALILADTGTDGVVISATTANQIADAILNRDFSSVSDTNARTALNALRFLRNKWSISGTTLTVTEEDDATAAWTAVVSTDASADPVTGNDPA